MRLLRSAIFILSFLLLYIVQRPTSATQKVSTSPSSLNIKISYLCSTGAVDKLFALCFIFLSTVWLFHYLCLIFFLFLYFFFFLLCGLVICGVLGSPFTWPRTLLSWYKSNNRVSLWVSWIILVKVLTWTHYYKWFLNMFNFFFCNPTLEFFIMQLWCCKRIHILLIHKAHQWFCGNLRRPSSSRDS